MGAQIPAIAEKPLPACGCRKFNLDALVDHLCTCTAHSGTKKAHDWAVDQLADLFRTTHKVKTQQVVLCIVDRFGSSSDPSPNGHLHYPMDIDRSINETAADKIRKYRADYNILTDSSGN
jgi:hypothetical protein